MIRLNISSKYKDSNFEIPLTQAAQAALKQHGASDKVELTLVLTGDAQIQKLNRQYRGENKATDVLSFPADEEDPETGEHYLGDVVISVLRAQKQAAAGGHALQDELQLLAVHGVLHLLGYDHEQADQRTQMWALQDRILEKLGLALRSAQAENAPH
jgi:probable rRNA maturation factor